MSSVELIRVLNEVGYPRSKDLKPCDWDWLFELGGGAGTFLSWLCHSVTAENVITSEERSAFTQLKEAEGVLEGTRLDEALAAQEEAAGDLQTDVEMLELELETKQAAVERLKRVRDQLCNENLSLSMELSQLSESQTAARAARHRQRQKLTGDELAVSDSRTSLAAAARQLTAQLSQSHGSLLSQTPLDGIEATEQRVSERLAELARRAFNSARGEPGAGDCSLLDLRPDRLSPDAAHSSLGAQLARLERVLPAAKRGAQRAAAEVAGLTDAVQLASRLVSDPQQPASTPARRRHAQELDASDPQKPAATPAQRRHAQELDASDPQQPASTPARRRHAQELDGALAVAAERYVQGILARACVGDHAAKLARQRQALQRQQEARQAAVQQLARLEWLRRAVAAESGGVAAAGDTLAAARQQTTDRLDQLNNRLRLMERTAVLAAEPVGDALGSLLEELEPAPGLPPGVQQATHRASLTEHLASMWRQLGTGRRLEAALGRSGVAPRTVRLEHAVRGIQPELKALVRQWDERKGGRRTQDTLWMLMMTSPARMEQMVLEAEQSAARAVR